MPVSVEIRMLRRRAKLQNKYSFAFQRLGIFSRLGRQGNNLEIAIYLLKSNNKVIYAFVLTHYLSAYQSNVYLSRYDLLSLQSNK